MTGNPTKTIFTSRKFWGAVIALIVIFVSQFVPGFEIDQEKAVALAVIVISYIVGTAIDPGPGGWKGVILSRKFWAAVIGLAVIFLDAFHLVLPFQLSTEQLVSIILIVAGYITGVAIEQPKNKSAASTETIETQPEPAR